MRRSHSITHRFLRTFATCTALLAFGVVGCRDQPTGPSEPTAGGTEERTLTWLAPLDDWSPKPETFDASANPIVTVCEWVDGQCSGVTLARFTVSPTGSDLPLIADALVGRYAADWDIHALPNLGRSTYRIAVQIGSAELGRLWIDATPSSWALTRLDGTEAALLPSATVPIRFGISRIAREATVSLDAGIPTSTRSRVAKMLSLAGEHRGNSPIIVAMPNGAVEVPVFALDAAGEALFGGFARADLDNTIGPHSSALMVVRIGAGFSGINWPRTIDSLAAAHPDFAALAAMIASSASQGMAFDAVEPIRNLATEIVLDIGLVLEDIAPSASRHNPVGSIVVHDVQGDEVVVPFPPLAVTARDGNGTNITMTNDMAIPWHARALSHPEGTILGEVTIGRRELRLSSAVLRMLRLSGPTTTTLPAANGDIRIELTQNEETRRLIGIARAEAIVDGFVQSLTTIMGVGNSPAIEQLKAELIFALHSDPIFETLQMGPIDGSIDVLTGFIADHPAILASLLADQIKWTRPSQMITKVAKLIGRQAGRAITTSADLTKLVFIGGDLMRLAQEEKDAAAYTTSVIGFVCQTNGVLYPGAGCELNLRLEPNGQTHFEYIGMGETDNWTFDANAGDTFLASIGEVGTNTEFEPWIRVYGPTGTLITGDFGNLAALINATAPTTGTYTISVTSGDPGNNAAGAYQLSFLRIPGDFDVPAEDEGGPLVPGTNRTGHIHIGDLDYWSFTGNAGETALINISENGGNPGFVPWLRLYRPDGAFVTGNFGQLTTQLSANLPTTGTYTLVVGTGDAGNDEVGDYMLTLIKAPGTTIVPAGDDGGPMTNGTNHVGHIHLGDLDYWTFTASAGASINISIGETGGNTLFAPWFRVYGPTGAFLSGDFGQLSALATPTAPMSGTYTVVVSSGDPSGDGVGDYTITSIVVPGPLEVSPGDEGGPISLGATHTGHIHIGDLDAWTFSANVGQTISVTLSETGGNTGFVPWIRILRPDGTFMSGTFNDVTAALSVMPNVSGQFTLIVGSADPQNQASGNYSLVVNVTGQ